MADIRVDADAMAAVADELSHAAHEISEARDGINQVWRDGTEAFGTTPTAAALAQWCGTWIGATDTVAVLTEGLATYTQKVAGAFGAADQSLSHWVDDMYTLADLPEEGETKTEYTDIPPEFIA